MSGRHTEPIPLRHIRTEQEWFEHVEATRRGAIGVAISLIALCLFAAGVIIWKLHS